MNADPLTPYLLLLSAFTEAGLPPALFEEEFVAMYQRDDGLSLEWSEAEAAVLERLSGALEEFVADARLRAALDRTLGPDELAASARRALRELRALRVQP